MGLTKRPASRAAVFPSVLNLLLAAAASGPAIAAGVDPKLADMAREARQVVAVIEWFYAEHHACPQPSRPPELAALRSELGDGYSAEPQGQFVEIRGISMPAANWLYYTSPRYPDRCTLWRKLGWDPALIWRRHRNGASWVLAPGDGSPEKTLALKP